jgi:hypothetical protein
MAEHPLSSLAAYSQFISDVINRQSIERSTISIWSTSPYTGVAEGELYFAQGLHLRMREELDFDAGFITSYGYEVYQGGEKLYWYDDFPHPNDPTLAATHPHHKHIPPNIKRNRVTAPGLRYEQPNLVQLIEEIERLIEALQ